MEAKWSVLTTSVEDTWRLAAALAKQLKPADVIGLYGDLGAGKTTFVQGLVAGLGLDRNQVNSPTFVLQNIYQGPLPVYHFDLYRLESEAEIEWIDMDASLEGQGVTVMEWAERMGSLMPDAHWAVRLEHDFFHQEQRTVTIERVGDEGSRLEKLKVSFEESV